MYVHGLCSSFIKFLKRVKSVIFHQNVITSSLKWLSFSVEQTLGLNFHFRHSIKSWWIKSSPFFSLWISCCTLHIMDVKAVSSWLWRLLTSCLISRSFLCHLVNSLWLLSTHLSRHCTKLDLNTQSDWLRSKAICEKTQHTESSSVSIMSTSLFPVSEGCRPSSSLVNDLVICG